MHHPRNFRGQYFGRLAVLALLVLGSLSNLPTLGQNHIVWQTNYADARQLAEKNKLPMIVVMGTATCYYCQKMETTTFSQKALAAVINRHFISLKIEAHRHPEFIRALRVTIYPTTVIAGSDGKIYAFLQGYQSAEKLQEKITEVLNRLPKSATGQLTTRPRDNKAISELEVTIPLPPIATLLKEARQAYSLEKYGEAYEKCLMILKGGVDQPEARDANKLLREIVQNEHKLGAVTRSLDERNAEHYLSLGESYLQAGRRDQAMTQFEKVLLLAPKSRAGIEVTNILKKLGIRPSK